MINKLKEFVSNNLDTKKASEGKLYVNNQTYIKLLSNRDTTVFTPDNPDNIWSHVVYVYGSCLLHIAIEETIPNNAVVLVMSDRVLYTNFN